jgi:hypothetical protein
MSALASQIGDSVVHNNLKYLPVFFTIIPTHERPIDDFFRSGCFRLLRNSNLVSQSDRSLYSLLSKFW